MINREKNKIKFGANRKKKESSNNGVPFILN